MKQVIFLLWYLLFFLYWSLFWNKWCIRVSKCFRMLIRENNFEIKVKNTIYNTHLPISSCVIEAFYIRFIIHRYFFPQKRCFQSPREVDLLKYQKVMEKIIRKLPVILLHQKPLFIIIINHNNYYYMFIYYLWRRKNSRSKFSNIIQYKSCL